MTYPMSVVLRALDAFAGGSPKKAIARDLGVSRAAVRSWVLADPAALIAARKGIGQCADGMSCPMVEAAPAGSYAYLLGQYLGDGCLTEMPRKVFKLRIAACDAYPGIASEIRSAIAAVLQDNRIGMIAREGCTEICVHSKHGICLFPQHGPGRKHTRPIRLADWQRNIVKVQTRKFLRGLIHSDGCRCINRVKVKGGYREYPRYFFSNRSEDILTMFTEACDLLDIEWKQNLPWSISIARRDSVAFLDTFVGTKK